MMLIGVFAIPEPEPQYPRKENAAPYAAPPAYSKPAYPKEEPYKQPAYGKQYDYCDPRKAPKCAKNDDEILCLKDEEYPNKDVEVKKTLNIEVKVWPIT